MKINFPCNSLCSDRWRFAKGLSVLLVRVFVNSVLEPTATGRISLLLFTHVARYVYILVIYTVCDAQGVVNEGVAAFRIAGEVSVFVIALAISQRSRYVVHGVRYVDCSRNYRGSGLVYVGVVSCNCVEIKEVY